MTADGAAGDRRRSSCGMDRAVPRCDAHRVLPDTDVLVVGDRIAEIGPNLSAPDGAQEIDAAGGIVMPGMVDTHRHMWQTALRGYGADWTLTAVLRLVLPRSRQDLPSAGHLRREPALVRSRRSIPVSRRPSTGRTACRPSSTARQRSTHSKRCPGRFVLGVRQHSGRTVGVGDLAGVQRFCEAPHGQPQRHARLPAGVRRARATRQFPERAAFEVARELGPAGRDARRRLGRDQRRLHPADARERLHDSAQGVRRTPRPSTDDSYHRIAATGGSCPCRPRASRARGQGYPPTWQLRHYDIPVSLSMDTSVWWSADLFTAMRTTLGADRSRCTSRRTRGRRRSRTRELRAEQVVDWATRGGARALGMDDLIGSIEVGKKADVVLIKNDRSPVMFPILNPTVTSRSRRSAATCTRSSSTAGWSSTSTSWSTSISRRPGGRSRRRWSSRVAELGEPEWDKGMNPDVPETRSTRTPTPTPTTTPARRSGSGRPSP